MIIKLIAAALIFAAGLIGGLLPLLSKDSKASYRLFYYGEYFARGIFVSAGIVHLLADSQSIFVRTHPHFDYPIIFAITVATIFFISLIETSTNKIAQYRSFSQSWMPYLLMILLSIHSIIAGAALGISTSLSQVAIIFIAIISHKTAASFALGINMRAHKVERKMMITLIIIFSLMTPFGVIASSIVDAFISSDGASLAQAIFGAIAAGTFIYIGAFNRERLELNEDKRARIIPTLYFGLGIALMIVVAIWL